MYTQADIRYRLPISILKKATSVGPNFCQKNGLSLALEGQEDLHFDFKNSKRRDIAIRLIDSALHAQFIPVFKSLTLSDPLTPSASVSPTTSSSDFKEPRTPSRSATSILAPLSRALLKANTITDPDGVRKIMPKVINLPRETLFARPSMHFMCLTIGSRGDIQPYIALGLGLQKEGHRVTIVTHEEYKEWVEGFGIGHRTAGGDPGALMKLSVENKACNYFIYR